MTDKELDVAAWDCPSSNRPRNNPAFPNQAEPLVRVSDIREQIEEIRDKGHETVYNDAQKGVVNTVLNSLLECLPGTSGGGKHG